MSVKTRLRLRTALAHVLFYTGAFNLLTRHGTRPWRILTYHRVIDPKATWYPLQAGMYVQPETFEMHIRYLKENTNIISLTEFTGLILNQKKIPSKTVVLTFDDGWVDTYTNAFPILRTHQVPATVFLATKYIDNHLLLWTDLLAMNVFFLCKSKQTLDSKTLIALLEDQNPLLASMIKRVLNLSELGPIEEAIESLIGHCKRLPSETRNAIISLLQEYAEKNASHALERCFLNWEEIKEMAQHGITFASHSHSHQTLDRLSNQELNDDISHSLSTLKTQLPTTNGQLCFCYPEGAYSSQTQTMLDELGFRFACTTERQSHLDASPLLLGRINIHEDISNSLPLFCMRIWG